MCQYKLFESFPFFSIYNWKMKFWATIGPEKEQQLENGYDRLTLPIRNNSASLSFAHRETSENKRVLTLSILYHNMTTNETLSRKSLVVKPKVK